MLGWPKYPDHATRISDGDLDMRLAKDLTARKRRWALPKGASNDLKVGSRLQASVHHAAVEVPTTEVIITASVCRQRSAGSICFFLLHDVRRQKLRREFDVEQVEAATELDDGTHDRCRVAILSLAHCFALPGPCSQK
jgi:hypothetical protein